MAPGKGFSLHPTALSSQPGCNEPRSESKQTAPGRLLSRQLRAESLERPDWVLTINSVKSAELWERKPSGTTDGHTALLVRKQ